MIEHIRGGGLGFRGGRGGWVGVGGGIQAQTPHVLVVTILYMFKESTHVVDTEGTKNSVVQMKYRIDQKLFALEMCSLLWFCMYQSVSY